jgi:hypothetical protein
VTAPDARRGAPQGRGGRPGARLTADQAGFLECVRAAGGVGLVVEDVRDLALALDAVVSG